MFPPYRSTFKRTTDYYNIHPRPQSPVAPEFEPLSPQSSQTTNLNRDHNTEKDSQWNKHTLFATGAHHGGVGLDLKRQQEHKDTQRRISNSINDLAEAALASGQNYSNPARKSSALYSNSYAGLQNGITMNGYSGDYSTNERPAKRARSEAGPSPNAHHAYARPSTSHVHSGPTYDVEQRIDRQGQRKTSNLEDAALLLNFASTFQPRPSDAPASGHVEAPLAPSALPPYIPPVQRPILHSDTDPSASLPSPREPFEDNRHGKRKERSKAERQSLSSIAEKTTSYTDHMTIPQQTQTPPEDEQSMDVMQGIEMSHKRNSDLDTASVSAFTGHDNDGDKPKQKRGWPKGKPRGPKKTGLPAKPRQSSAKRSRKSAVKGKADMDDAPPVLPRRKSEVDISLPHGELTPEPISRNGSVPPDFRFVPGRLKVGRKAVPKVTQDTICAGCEKTRDSSTGEHDQWISCNGCKKWLHSDCAGFRNEREIRDVDKFFCKNCEPKHGITTFVRKSTRAHTAVDYAGLNQGVLRTSDDCNEHHYIQPIKDGTLFNFDQEYFARIRPELVTREYFERSAMFSEPVLIPAELNPPPKERLAADQNVNMAEVPNVVCGEEILPEDFEYETAPDDGQDKLGMIIPQDLTVRKVCNLVGPDYPLEVIDVKEQGTNGVWNMAKWTDYYEQEGEKEIRNVISLEVSETKLGRLLRRPKIVRQIDLQDNVWPADEPAKSVAFYCLMSAADSYTDFHIDFGGSSVYYHILRGSKTFFFIPPKAKNLRLYEEWNNDPNQNHTFLGEKTKECYRVDLKEGDTMLIPSGWIHAVWTPANSLVIGGNFLTHMHLSMQFKVSDIEKANKTPLKFRYPKFQKVMWYSVLKYLEEDPLPESVRDTFYSGKRFERDIPTWQIFDTMDVDAQPGTEHYNARYYSQMELDGLPELVSFIFRTVMIQLDRIEGITEETRKNVMRSIPKSGEPLEIARTFAFWVAWKRGGEDPPAWAHPGTALPEKSESGPKKLSAKMLKQMQRQEAIEAYRVAPDRQSARQQAAAAKAEADKVEAAAKAATEVVQLSVAGSPAPSVKATDSTSPQITSTPKTSVLGPKRVACDACRKRRIRCKHKDVLATPDGVQTTPVKTESSGDLMGYHDDHGVISVRHDPVPHSIVAAQETPRHIQHPQIAPPPPMMQVHHTPQIVIPPVTPGNTFNSADASAKRGRSKACTDCRKSKRRCIHDENGKVDPVKEKQTPVARGTAPKKRKSIGDADESPGQKRVKTQQSNSQMMVVQHYDPQLMQEDNSSASAFQPNMQSAPIQDGHPYATLGNGQWPEHHVYPDPQGGFAASGTGGPYHPFTTGNGYDLSSLQQFANDVLDLNGDPNQSQIHPDLRGPLQSGMAPQLNGMIDYNGLEQVAAANHHESVDSGISMPQENVPKHADVVRVAPALPEDNHVVQPNDANSEHKLSPAPLQSHESSHQLEQVLSNVVAVVERASASNAESSTTTTEGSKSRSSLPSSPLTEPTRSPEPVSESIKLSTETSPRQPKSMNADPKVGAALHMDTPSKKRTSTTPATDRGSAKKARLGSGVPADSEREKSVAEVQEEESMKLVRELQSESFGLRQRKSVSGA